jgi:hypothetical protein
MPRIKDRHHTDVLVDGDVIHHTYKGSTWKAVYTNGTFVDTENSVRVYYTPTEFANAHLAVKTGVNGLRACKVERGGKLIAIANLFGAVPATETAPVTTTATIEAPSAPPKPKMTFQSMKRQATATGGAGEVAVAATPPVATVAPTSISSIKKPLSETTTPPPRKRKLTAPKKAPVVVTATISAPAIVKIITPRVVESKDEPLEIFEVEDIIVEEVSLDGVKYYKDTRGETLYNYDDGQVGSAIKRAEEQDA